MPEAKITVKEVRALNRMSNSVMSMLDEVEYMKRHGDDLTEYEIAALNGIQVAIWNIAKSISIRAKEAIDALTI